jgi:hypothetical protein
MQWKLGKIKVNLFSHTSTSFILLFLSIIVYIFLCIKNIATFGYWEEDNCVLQFRDEVVRIDDGERVWCDCKENEKTTCKRYGIFIFRECAPNLSLKVGNTEIPILIGPHMGSLAPLLLRLYIKISETLGIEGKDMNMKDRVILMRSFGVFVGILYIVAIFILTSKLFGYPAAGISSILLSTDTLFILGTSSLSNIILAINYLPVLSLLTISLAISIIAVRIRIKTKVILILISVLIFLLLPHILYALKSSEASTVWGFSPLKYAYHRLVSSPKDFVENFFRGLIFIFGNKLPDAGRFPWILSGTGQNYTFEIIRVIFVAAGFASFIFSEKNQKLKHFFIILILSYVLLLSPFDTVAHHYIVPSFILYIACAKGITELKIRLKSKIIPLYIPLVFLLILFSSIGIIINSKKIIEANMDKLLEPKLKVVEFLMRNNIKRVVEIPPEPFIPIGMLTDGKVKLVSYVIAFKNAIDNNIRISEFYRKLFLIERNSVFIYKDASPDGIYYLAEKSGFKVKELYRVTVEGKFYIVLFTVE